MKPLKIHYLLPFAAVVFMIVQLSLSGCKKYDNENSSPGGTGQTGQMSVLMTDAPGNFLSVNVHIKSVQVHTSDTNNASGWITLNTHDTIYDLLKLQNDITVALANGIFLPVGKITQLRLILDSDNTVVLSDSSTHNLVIPSSLNTGIKINIDAQILPGKTVVVTLDFDADESIHLIGTGDYKLSPVIKVKHISQL